MAWCYRKRIKIIPGVHLNFSKNGISTSIGVRGMNITYGNKGTYANIGIPGTGIYNRFKISSNEELENDRLINIYNPSFTPIISSDILTVTSSNMEGVKDLILKTRAQRLDIANDIKTIKKKIRNNYWCRFFLYFIYPIVKNKIKSIKIDLCNQRRTVEELAQQLENCYVNLDIEFDSEILAKYQSFLNSFKKLSQSHKIWHITSYRKIDEAERIQTRKFAGHEINRNEVKFGIQSLPEIKSTYDVLCLQNKNGNDLYFYPNFLIIYSSIEKYAIIDYSDLQINYYYRTFIETEFVPKDGKIVGYTWNKTNKNGTPDKRFKDNYQIPIAAYGELFITTSNGVKEDYYCSNNEATKDFSKSYNEYRNILERYTS